MPGGSGGQPGLINVLCGFVQSNKSGSQGGTPTIAGTPGTPAGSDQSVTGTFDHQYSAPSAGNGGGGYDGAGGGGGGGGAGASTGDGRGGGGGGGGEGGGGRRVAGYAGPQRVAAPSDWRS